VDIIIIITGKGWVSSPDWAKFGVAPRGAGVEPSKFKILLPVSLDPQNID